MESGRRAYTPKYALRHADVAIRPVGVHGLLPLLWKGRNDSPEQILRFAQNDNSNSRKTDHK